MSVFLAVALAHFLALLSPGPDFLMVVRSAARHPVRVALGVPAGIAIANGVYIALCLLGVATVLSQSAGLLMIVRIAGGLFLLWLGVMALRARRSDYAFLMQAAAAEPIERASSFWREAVIGFASGILNPKNLLFYLSLFSLVLTPEVAIAFKVGLGLWMVLVVFAWDALIVLVLSHGAVRMWFNRTVFYIDKFTGLVLGAIGAKIVHGAATHS
ncbi:lysine transporter LysE [Lampropedia puyangensis]|uniref:Lysine transporter LysE n=1 Tax=Lampropedia puyangensis TaxID=1330072 RepID=A0A4S8F053_9BURK|nr:LysE family transporter [Lampropedia puyangensis]THU00628.1 lysine transporter LysE [Lampropedia puyangensis]